MPKEKFVAVGADLRPGHASEEFRRAARRSRGSRAKLAKKGASRVILSGSQLKILAFTWLGLLFMAIYALTIGAALFRPGYSLADRIASVFLLGGMAFIALHGAGYANSMIKALWGHKSTKTRLFVSSDAPQVACLIASFNEPAEVLEETVAAVVALDYPNKRVVILDDSTREENSRAAREIARKFGVECVQRTNRRGYKAGAINDFLQNTEAQYLAIFDADALPTTNFLKEIIPVIGENPSLAFVQTPQFYANVNASYVALAAARQQNVFYEYICEGKSYSRAAFCCGTNVIFRRAALLDVGGFDEKSVTEDFATSFLLHLKGWDSLYFNRTFVYSLAPENLAAYFTQQSRWSFGSLGVFRFLVKPFFQNPRALRAGQWAEYFLSTTYYGIGVVNLIFMVLPLLTIFFGIRPLQQDVFSYLAVFVPYFLFTLNMFYAGMENRGYQAGQMILGQQIGFISFPVHISSAFSALLGRKRPFALTPKGVSGRVSWFSLWPQIAMLLLSAAGVGWGIYLYASGKERNTTAILVNSFWALYHVWMLGSIFKLNQPVREGLTTRQFFQNGKNPVQGTLSALSGVKNPLSLNRVATLTGAVCALIVGFFGWHIVEWNRAPKYPVNLYIVDRTMGQSAGGHESLFWTLNFLKVKKQSQFGPQGDKHTFYDKNLDYYGYVADPKASAVREPKTGKTLIYGNDRPLPPRLSEPGALFILDTYGEFADSDNSARKVRFRARRRGIGADEIERIDAFARRGGLLLAEWNTLSFPTRPGSFVPEAQLQAAVVAARKRVRVLERITLAQAQNAVEIARAGKSAKALSVARGKVADVRGQIVEAEAKLRGFGNQKLYNRVGARQNAAAQRLESLLHVSYAGWYGQWVDDFAQQKIYNSTLWKLVRADLTRANKGKTVNPSGPGFVFYPDGPGQVFDAQTQTLKSPSNRPIAILGRDLGLVSNTNLATIRKTRDQKLSSDPILRGVAESVPFRHWFDVVRPEKGARVLASYELPIAPSAAQRLKNAGFPARNLSADGQKIVFPALVAWRDENQNNGELRSLYFAGDAAGYPEIAHIAQRFPALGGVDRVASARYGSFSSQFFWNYYEPVLRNVFEDTPRIRHKN